MDVVTLGDQMVRVARFSCRFFTAMAANKAEKKNQGSSMYFYDLGVKEVNGVNLFMFDMNLN